MSSYAIDYNKLRRFKKVWFGSEMSEIALDAILVALV